MKRWLVAWFICWPLVLMAQEQLPAWWLEAMEELQANEGVDWEEELRALEYLHQHPIELNSATRDELRQLLFLSDELISNLLSYIERHGPMQTTHELALVKGMEKQVMEWMNPFVCVEVKPEQEDFPSLKRILKGGRHELLTRLDQPFYTRRGYENKYLGTKQYHSLRYEYTSGNRVQAGFTAEKDAGEPLAALHNKWGYDHYGAYLMLNNLGRVKRMTLGNYRLNFGLGLVAGSGFRIGKGTTLSTVHYRPATLRPHTSTDEYNYLTGGAATVQLVKHLEATAFYSRRLLDATIKEGVMTSIDKTGLHRSPNEADKVHATVMQTMGGNLTWDANRWKVGLTGMYYFLDKEYRPNLQRYSKYYLQGNHFYNLGMEYQLRLGGLNVHGEVAKGKKGWAALNRLYYAFSPAYKVMLVHRYYAHDYWSFFGHAFGESSTPQNENGWYLATEMAPWSKWRIFASIDLFSFPWWRYRISKASQGVDVSGRISYSPTPQLSMYVTYRMKRKERDVTGTGGEVIEPYRHHKARYRLSWTPGAWMLRTTADYNCFAQRSFEPQEGFLVSQMAGYKAGRWDVQVQGAYFHTDSYDARVYSYEKGLLHTFYTPSFYGEGFRYSAHLRYDSGKHWTVLLKWGETIYGNRESISSGDDLIRSNRKGDLQMQVRLKF